MENYAKEKLSKLPVHRLLGQLSLIELLLDNDAILFIQGLCEIQNQFILRSKRVTLLQKI